MLKRFLITNALMFIQNRYAEQIFNKNGVVTIDGESARIIETSNCDNYTQIGTPGSQESYLFDLDGTFYVVPESWAKQKLLRIANGVNSSDFTFVEAVSVNDLAVTATSDTRPTV